MIFNLPDADKSGFTIVELLVVIVVIGILAAITIVSYSGISQKAQIATVQADLASSASKLKMYYAAHGSYPSSLAGDYCPIPSDSDYCLKTSANVTYQYISVSPYSTFSLIALYGNITYRITDKSAPMNFNPIFTTGGTVSETDDTRTHTFGTSCTSGSPCTINAATSGTINITIDGAGGGGGGGFLDWGQGSSGGNGGLSSVTRSGTAYTANGGTGGIGGDIEGCAFSDPWNGSNGSFIANGLTGTTGGGSAGGVGGASRDGGMSSCPGGNGGNGGRVTGSLSITSGQSLSIIVGSGGGGGGPAGAPATGGSSGAAGSVTVSYSY